MRPQVRRPIRSMRHGRRADRPSGSAAAVADHMVSFALATQTGGSILRPASFCGVVGYKPTFGTFNREGLKFAAESLDTIGVIARTIADVALVHDILVGRPPTTIAPIPSPPRIGVCRTYLWNDQSVARDAIDHREGPPLCCARRAPTYRTSILPPHFARLTPAREIINDVERARSLAWEWTHHRALLSGRMQTTIARGLATDDTSVSRGARFR